MKTRIAMGVLVAGLALVPSMSNAEDDAWTQLQDATSGTQSTGWTFDGGPGPTDAYPTGDVYVPEVPEPVPVDSWSSTDTYETWNSTDTTGSYDTSTSTDTTGGYTWGTSSGWETSTDTGSYDTGGYETGSSYDVGSSTDTSQYGEEPTE